MTGKTISRYRLEDSCDIRTVREVLGSIAVS